MFTSKNYFEMTTKILFLTHSYINYRAVVLEGTLQQKSPERLSGFFTITIC